MSKSPIGALITHYRGVLCYTKVDLAFLLDTTTYYISSIESGKKIPTLNQIIMLANVLRIDWHDLPLSPLVRKILSLRISEEDREFLLENVKHI